jgi:hypothetical protein
VKHHRSKLRPFVILWFAIRFALTTHRSVSKKRRQSDREPERDTDDFFADDVVSFPVDSTADQELLESAKAKSAQSKKSRSGGFES